MTQISPLAFVTPDARIGDNVTIMPFAYIESGTVIGDNCVIHPHVSILEGTILGNGVKVHEGAVIAATPQDFRWDGAKSRVIIGNDTVIREHVIINRSSHENMATEIGEGTFIMAQTHIGHDTYVGNHCVIGNAVRIAGNCKIGNCTILSSNSLIHENYEVGDWVLIKGGCRINGNVPPYVVMAHNPVEYYGVNSFILRREGFTDKDIEAIAKCYRHVYQCNTSVFNAVRRINEDIRQGPARDAILDFIRNHNNKLVAIPHDLQEE